MRAPLICGDKFRLQNCKLLRKAILRMPVVKMALVEMAVFFNLDGRYIILQHRLTAEVADVCSSDAHMPSFQIGLHLLKPTVSKKVSAARRLDLLKRANMQED